MSAEAITQLWFFWLIVGGIIVVAAAALLLTIIGLAHRIARLAGMAQEIVVHIEENTRPIWDLGTTNRVANDTAGCAEEIAGNTEHLATALGGSHATRSSTE